MFLATFCHNLSPPSAIFHLYQYIFFLDFSFTEYVVTCLIITAVFLFYPLFIYVSGYFLSQFIISSNNFQLSIFLPYGPKYSPIYSYMSHYNSIFLFYPVFLYVSCCFLSQFIISINISPFIPYFFYAT